MTELEEKLFQIKLSLTTTIKGVNLGPVWDKSVPDRWLSFCPKLGHFVDHLWLLLENSPFKNFDE